MRCDTAERLFEGLLDGTLSPVQRSGVETHLAACKRCSAILEELRVVDALLLVPRRLEPAPNFTFRTMAEIRVLPAPRRVRQRWPWLFALYLALSWIGIGAWLAVGRPDGPAIAVAGIALVGHLAGALDGIARVAGTGFGLSYAGIAGIVMVLLVLDVALLCAALMLRAFVRPRIAAHLARSEAG